MKQKCETESVAVPFGEIELVKLTNRRGASVTLSSLGAGVTSIIVPDRYGRMADIALGYDNPADYMADGPCAGKIPGRYANRIAGGRFTLDGVDYQLAVNNGPNALHGGPTGFQNRLWDTELVAADTVRFSRHSPDGEEGYPGAVNVEATYRWTDDCSLELTLSARTDRQTVINLTNHSYFNLSGHDSGSVLGQSLQLFASRYLPTDQTLIPTGEAEPVAGTPMDFTTPHPLGYRIHDDFPALTYGKGYDSCWLIDHYDMTIRPAAILTDPVSGRRLTVLTDQPAVQVYTGNWLDGCPTGKGGYRYSDYDAVAIECQDIPDAPNQPALSPASVILTPGAVYRRHIIYNVGIS